MSQKKERLKKQKLKDQAEILYTSSMVVDTDAGKLNLIVKAALIVKGVRCSERTKYFKEAVVLAEGLRLWKIALKLAALALRKNDERDFFLEIQRRYRGKIDKMP